MRLIGNLNSRLNGMHNEIVIVFAQFLSLHKSYLLKIGKTRSTGYVFCNGLMVDAGHKFFL